MTNGLAKGGLQTFESSILIPNGRAKGQATPPMRWVL
jgi:hypothetical protein